MSKPHELSDGEVCALFGAGLAGSAEEPADAANLIEFLVPEEARAEKRYRLGALVARGGMGAILEAWQNTMKRSVAMKVLRDDESADQITRFISEAQITGRLEHPNIVPVHELGVNEQGRLFYTMKRVRGRTLAALLTALGEGRRSELETHSLPTLLTIFQKTCDAVAFAHSRAIIHRDLKPENIMLGDFGEVLVMDWGLAKPIGSREAEPAAQGSSANRAAEAEFGGTLAGAVMGTPQYMAPEQARGENSLLDVRTDVYALGAVLYHLLALRPALATDEPEAMVGRAARGEVLPVPERAALARAFPAWASRLPGGGIPESLAAVVRKAMAWRPEDRYASVPELQREVAAYQAGFATKAESASLIRQINLLVRRHRALAASFAGSALALAALAGVAFGRVKEARDRAERALAELRGAAPTFEAQSRALMATGQLDEALAKIGYAVNLAPDRTDYRRARADLLQSTPDLAAAAVEYRRVLALQPRDAHAGENLALCTRLLAKSGGARALPPPLLGELLEALIAQHRDLEAAPLSALLHSDERTAEATIRARLASFTAQPGWKAERIKLHGTLYAVDLSALQIGDLNLLRGLPIGALNLDFTTPGDLHPLASLPLESLSLNSCGASDLSGLRGLKLHELLVQTDNLTDLAPLEGMPLETLLARNNRISDLSPLRGAPLSRLDLANNRVEDLSPLAGMPLTYLNLRLSPVADLAPLRGMPLGTLSLESCDRVRDFSPLVGSPTLKQLSLPYLGLRDVAFLERLPRLQQVAFQNGESRLHYRTLRDFLASWSPQVPEIAAARAALAAGGLEDIPIHMVFLDTDHRLVLETQETNLADLAPLRGLPIKEITLRGTRVRDLEPLRGAPLVRIRADSPLIRDVGPLADSPTLEEIVLPPGVPSHLEALRALPNLKYLSQRWSSTKQHPVQTAEEFWRELDARKARPAN